MAQRVVCLAVLLTGILLLGPNAGIAAIYKYMDKNGVPCFADDLHAVPEEYRKSAVMVGGEAAPEQKPVQPAQPPQPEVQGAGESKASEPPVAAQGPDLAPEEHPWKKWLRWVVSLVVIASGIAVVMVLRRGDTEHKRSLRIARYAIAAAVVVYLLIAHVGDIAYGIFSIKSSIDSAQREAEEKGKKAAKAIKTMENIREAVEKGVPIPAVPENKDKESKD